MKLAWQPHVIMLHCNESAWNFINSQTNMFCKLTSH